jgi:hypothetical protein
LDAAHVVGTLTAKRAGEKSVEVYPSGPVTTTANITEPEEGIVDASAYTPTDAECDAAVYVHVGVVP